MSYGIASAARNIPIESGSNIVLNHEQFPGNVYVWKRLAAERGASIRTPAPPDSGPGRGRIWNERILDEIDRDTAVVSIAPVHWTDGTRFDLETIGARARDVGAAFVVDGTQAIGAAPFDYSAVRPDALICTGYKWLLGPYSTAVGYFGERFDSGVPLEETWIAREGSEDFSNLVNYRDEYRSGSVRFDVGERSNFILLPMLIASLRLLLEWRPERIQAYCRELTSELLAEAPNLGISFEEEGWRSAHIAGLRMPAGVNARALKERLQERRIYASLRGSALRVAPNVYNTPADLAALLEVLSELLGD